MQSKAYDQGRKDYYADYQRTRNRYKPGTADHAQWLAGWDNAQDEFLEEHLKFRDDESEVFKKYHFIN